MSNIVTCDELLEKTIQEIEHASQADKDRIITALGVTTKEEFCKLINAPTYFASMQIKGDNFTKSKYAFEVATRVGYAFHPEDNKDPKATVGFNLCGGGSPEFMLYPDSDADHNIEVSDCEGNVIGYALNKPFIAYSEDFDC